MMFLLTVTFYLTIHYSSMVTCLPPDLTSFDPKVNQLLDRMTIEEKVGQMTQVTIDVILTDANKPWNEIEINAEKLRIAVHDYKVGSILNVAGTGAYSLEQWHRFINMIQDSASNTNLKIPILYGLDSIHGASYVRDSVLFPQGIAMAATFNPSLAKDLGRITAHQTRAAGVPWNFYPQVDIGRQKLWPRLWETFGEDVKLVKDMGRAYTEGLQGDDLTSRENVAACLKHYVGYGFPISGQDRTPAWIDERLMHEYFLPPFEESVRAGAVSVMVNSGEVNGIPGHANHHLITEILKEKYNFQGFVVSDWEDIKRLHTRDHTAATPKEAVRQAIMAGLDMSMVPFDFTFYNYTLEGIRDGSIPQSRIDDAVRRILRVKFALGLFDGRNAWPDPASINTFNQSDFENKNLEAAQQVVTLLKNEMNALPLQLDKISQAKPILITGPTADLVTVLNGGWSYTWQGSMPDMYPEHYRNKTILRSLMNKIPNNAITYFPMPSFQQLPDINSLLNAANAASYIIVCLGEHTYTETPGNINQLTLDDAQLELVERIRSRTGVPIITVLVEGRPRIIRRIVNISSAIIMMYLPGMQGGQALTDVLLGDYNPNGRLPITYPRYEHRLTNYDHKWNEAIVDNYIDVEFDFGFGLSYTTFSYSNLRVSKNIEWNDMITITIEVANTGSRAGYHTILLYVSDLYRTVTPPVKELKAYTKPWFNVNERKTIQFNLTRHDLSFIGINMNRQTEPGDFEILVGDQKAQFTLNGGDDPVPSRADSFSPVNFSFILIMSLTLIVLFKSLVSK